MTKVLGLLLVGFGLWMCLHGLASPPSSIGTDAPPRATATPAAMPEEAPDRSRREGVPFPVPAASAPRSTGEGAATATLTILVVDGRGRPVPEALLRWGDQRAMARARDLYATSSVQEPPSLPDRLATIGAATSADAQGRARIQVVGDHVVLCAEAGGQSGLLQIDRTQSPKNEYVLVIEDGDVLVLEVADPQGNALEGVPLALHFGPASGGDASSSIEQPLGSTDPHGRVIFRGLRSAFAVARARLGQQAVSALALPQVLGIDATMVAAVPERPLGPVRIVLPRPMVASMRVVSAGGTPFAWEGTVVHFPWPGQHSAPAGMQVHGGELQALVVPGADGSYRVHCRGQELGSGRLAGAGAGGLRLACEHVWDVVGIAGDLPTASSFAVALRSPWRGQVQMPLDVDETRRFRFALHRDELACTLRFTSGASSCEIVPAVVGPRTDVGTLDWGAAVFGTVEVVDDSGQPLALAQLSATGAPGQARASSIEARGGGRFAIRGTFQHPSLTIRAHLANHAESAGELVRGGVLRLELPRLRPQTVLLRAAVRVAEDAVWLCLRQRWHEGQGQWLLQEDWASLAAVDEVHGFSFAQLPAGRYRYDLLSIRPAVLLASGEFELPRADAAAAATVDGSPLRPLSLQLSLPAGSGPAFLVAPEEPGALPPVRLVRAGAGTHELVVRSDQTVLWCVGAGLLPVAVPLTSGTMLSVAMRTLPSPPPGLPPPPTPIQPAPRFLHARQNSCVYAVENRRVVRQFAWLSAWAAEHGDPLWPTDYLVGENGGIARFAGDRWLVQR
jgi:hypothetical protein